VRFADIVIGPPTSTDYDDDGDRLTRSMMAFSYFDLKNSERNEPGSPMS